jgi:hypothetical protein
MRAAWVFGLLCIVGAALPLSQFLPWFAEYGLDPTRFASDLFANRIGGFFGLDVIVSAIVLFAWVYWERDRPIRGRWAVVPATLLVGVSLGLPLYLVLRLRATPAV